MIEYTLDLENDNWYDIISFTKFCKENQGQDIKIIVNQESHCLRYCKVYEVLDLFQFNSVTLITCNAVEEHPKYTIDNSTWSHWLSIGRMGNFDHAFDYSWDKDQIFGCFYGRPSASRLGIAGYLSKKYSEQSLIKILFDSSQEDTRKGFELSKLFSWDSDSLINTDHLLSSVTRSTNQAWNCPSNTYDYKDPLNYLYKHIFIDIISEPVNQGRSFYPTEKLARAVLCKKPFLVMGSKHYLRYLRQIGFKTFREFWDEGYDDMTPKDRYHAILKLIDTFASKSDDELIILNNEIQSLVEHNYRVLTEQSFNNKVKRYIPYYE
jgi:hypothetical protein